MSFALDLEATVDSTIKPRRNKTMEIALETSLMRVSNSFQFPRIGIYSTIQAGYFFTSKWSTGLFYSRMLDISKSNTYFVIDEKVIDVSTSSLSNYGLYTRYSLIQEDDIRIVPELRLGYGISDANSANFNNNVTKNTIEMNMFTIQPKINIVYDLSDIFGIGISGGYLFPFNVSNKNNLRDYDIQNLSVGLNFHFNL